ncbi:MAG: hypothetical protein KC478_08565, partial [Bacteriovoracaceae bacterium]|nr:hypothetical protein [Bacteriovoracaceae bacterium]
SPMGSCLQSGAASSAPTGAYFTPMERKKINLSAMWLHPDFREQFEEYSYLEEVTVAQMFELIQRKLYQNIFITNAVAEDGFEEQPSQPEPENSQLQDTIVNIGAPIAANQLLNSSSASPVLEVAADQPLQAIQEASKSELGTGVKGWIDKSIATPWVRAALSGALGTYASMLKNNAKKNENLSKKRIEALDEILVSFVDSGGARFDLACSEEEKDNPSKPECYCFNDSGSQNVQRQDRVVCKAYFEQRNLIANKYSGLGNLGYSPVKACIQTDGEVDLDCSVCKKTPSKCPVVASASLGTINLPKSLGVESLMKQSNSIASGRMELAQLDTAGLEKKAARISSITDKLGEKKPYKEILSKVKNLENDFLKAAPALFKKSFGSSGASSSPLASSGSNAPITPSKKTSEKASEDAGKTGIQMKSAGTYTATGSTKAQEDFDFGFGDENQGGVEIVGDAQDVMKKDFAIKGDIHKNSQTNIFQILSLRYQRSALRRLFGTPETSSESNAQGTEIEQK